jgi:A/G-specific adenine glycosylase
MTSANPSVSKTATSDTAAATSFVDLPPETLSARLLDWYDHHHRQLPWRSEPGETADPYHVWLSEIMLQQTTVAAVGKFFRRFIELWPSVHDLAAAPRDDVLAEWAGLGYYARARNLHACAKMVSEDLGGRFPQPESALLKLPGVGPYTAAAISAIAFDQQSTILDGNVERVIARLRLVTDPLPAVKSRLKVLASSITPSERPGDYAQAIMDLGATVCTPRSPKCMLCPWAEACRGRVSGIAAELPRKLKKAPKPTRQGVAFFLVGGAGDILLRRRVDKGLLGGMTEVPSTPWQEMAAGISMIEDHAPFKLEWTPLQGKVRHTFTHFHLELTVMAARMAKAEPIDGFFWHPIDKIGKAGLPSVMAKVVKHAAIRLSQDLGSSAADDPKGLDE